MHLLPSSDHNWSIEVSCWILDWFCLLSMHALVLYTLPLESEWTWRSFQGYFTFTSARVVVVCLTEGASVCYYTIPHQSQSGMQELTDEEPLCPSQLLGRRRRHQSHGTSLCLSASVSVCVCVHLFDPRSVLVYDPQDYWKIDGFLKLNYGKLGASTLQLTFIYKIVK